MGYSYLLFGFAILCLLPQSTFCITRHYTFNIVKHNVTRLCTTKSIVSVNGRFPGPRIIAREGDRVIVKVINQVSNNISIHWHGLRQLANGWADGPAYVTQCPIQFNKSYTYNFTIIGQRGTLFWHAHISWLRATVYGPIIILPRRNESYPFKKPYKQIPIMFGEWWNVDTEAVINQALQTGGGPNVSDAYTINGLPGPLYNCSSKVFITPGQTTNVLLKTKPHFPNATFLMAAQPYFSGLGTFDNSTVAGILEYESPLHSSPTNKRLGSNPCPKNMTCQGPNGTKFAASVNNISFILPTTALLQSHYFGQSNGIYTTDFPVTPLNPFNYTGSPQPNNTFVTNATKVVVLPFNSSVEVVLQDTSILGAENHPLHLHGHNFFVVGEGFGNFDPNNDPSNFNLKDPIQRNTVGVPAGGWIAFRFFADNPGVWFMHCHFEVHTSWGLRMAWIVLDGSLPSQKLPPPPSDLPKC
ncbi:hypothetical protein EJD97_021995 [Solanum chilense]|uniref:Laccase n=1 Tax=Solanum chilense TaxID=4083 RepID=A0A6N2B2B6_SOLCI|nr:hypothetical protein EJD97_021995 [Solanum chilense]